MKVLHTGNLANNSYKLAKFQRRLGVDARLFIDSDQVDTNDDPAWEDPELKSGYPDWIEVLNVKREVSLARKVKTWIERIRFGRRYVRDNRVDIVHAQVTSPLFAQFFGAPVLVTHCLGSDLREVAFSRTWKGLLLRRAYKKSRVVFFNNVDHVDYLDRLGIKGQFLPNPLDLGQFSPDKGEISLNDYNLVILHPSSQDFGVNNPGPRGRRIGLDTKGNDRLIRAFARFVKKNPDALLVMIRSGVDIKPAMELIDHLQISANVKFIDRMNKEDLIVMLNSADVVADQFDVGAFGGVALEAMACGKPLITYLKEDCALRCYPELPPTYNCSSEDGIFEALYRAADDNLNVIGEKNREWIEKYHDWRSVAKNVVEHYERALSQQVGP